jgi:hypothetical protein
MKGYVRILSKALVCRSLVFTSRDRTRDEK